MRLVKGQREGTATRTEPAPTQALFLVLEDGDDDENNNGRHIVREVVLPEKDALGFDSGWRQWGKRVEV